MSDRARAFCYGVAVGIIGGMVLSVAIVRISEWLWS